MNVSAGITNNDDMIEHLAPAAGGHEMKCDQHTLKNNPQVKQEHHGECALSSIGPSPQDTFNLPSAEEDGETEIIEVFRFDRNSLKLRCEEISPKQLKAAATLKQNGLKNSSAAPGTVENKKVESSSSSSSSSCSSSSSESDDDGTSSSSTSTSSSSSSSASSSSKTNSASTPSSTLASTSNEGKNSSKKTESSSCSGSSSCTSASSSSSTSSSSSSSSETEETASNCEDEGKKKGKIRTRKKKLLHIATKNCSDLSNKNSSFSNNTPTKVPLIESGSVHIKMEINEEEATLSNNPGKILKLEQEEDDEEEDEEDEDLDNELVNINDLVEGRNKQRKNSKWGDYIGARKSSRLAPRASFSNKNYEAQIKKRLRALLKKPSSEWTDDDRTTIQSFPKLVSEVEQRIQRKEVASERLKECEDPPDVLERKCAQLASVISHARYLIIYTGAGISTSAKIPDYRGPNGIWTLLQKGEQVTQSLTDISQTADPTLTHMAIKTLYDRQICKHIVSQNVDGLHLRSGVPKVALSEVHGNMYVEACTKCGREFVRLFDVTENTRRHHHKTGRFCYHCGTQLRDTVVLFGEKGSLRWPLNWQGAEYNVDRADAILCLGSSLKVLRRYPWLWSMAKPPQKRPQLYIVNLQWTPKDQFARLKINGKCDEVMEKVMNLLNIPIPQYKRENDAIFTLATILHPSERHTKSSSELWYPSDVPYPEKNKDLRNYIRFEPIFKVPNPYEQNIKIENSDNSIVKRENDEVCATGRRNEDDVIREGDTDNNEEDSNLSERQEQTKQRKRVLKGNNFSWLGNTVISKLQKKRKLK